MVDYFDRDGRPISQDEWVKLWGDPGRIVRKTEVGVSTERPRWRPQFRFTERRKRIR